MKQTFTWIPIYSEIAKAILAYKNDRKTLLSLIYESIDPKYTSYLQDEYKNKLEDICPFTAMGIFNRGNTDDNRKLIISKFKAALGLSADTPDDFSGIPTMNNQKSWFFGFKSKRQSSDIDNLWTLFDNVLSNKDIQSIYDAVIGQYCIKINITMGLFWISPSQFIALDGLNKARLESLGINIGNKVPCYTSYNDIMDQVKQLMATNKIREKSFYEFSYNTWSDSRNENHVFENPDEDYFKEIVDLLGYKKNIILQGAPGVGKTYDVPEIAVRLCEPDIKDRSRDNIEASYKELVKKGQIVFTTFHQSMDYEEFVEGIRPEVENDTVTYNVKDGIFKTLCSQAQIPIVNDVNLGLNQNPTIWKVSLASTYNNPVRTDCLANNRIRIGWDAYGEDLTDEKLTQGGHILNAFVNKMKIGDIVISCYSNQITDAIGVVTSDYYYDEDFDEYKRVRDVKWLIKGIKENIYELNNYTQMTLSTVYRLNNISLSGVMGILEKHGVVTTSTIIKNNNPYILIIDEINRGNLSKIFGELITLLEPDKRIGENGCEIKVRLPYSQTEFGVPDNVYIIGTMNTADRSLGYIDYAMRRRFAMIDMKPVVLSEDIGFNENVFRRVAELFICNYNEYIASDSIEEVALVPAYNLSDEYRPEDVWLGQSYFIMKDNSGKDVTSLRIKYEIIPILREYLKDGVFKREQEVNDVIKLLLDNYYS